MTRERVIWRPNAIPLEVWEAMTREDQITWWKAQEEPPEPKRHMKVAISMYQKGMITLGEFVCLAYSLLRLRRLMSSCDSARLTCLPRSRNL